MKPALVLVTQEDEMKNKEKKENAVTWISDIIPIDEKSSEKKDRRKIKRVAIDGDLVLHDSLISEMHTASILNIHKSGMGCATLSSNFTVEEKVNIEFMGNNKVPPFRALCEVKNFTKDENKSYPRFYLGLEFINLSPLNKRILSHLK